MCGFDCFGGSNEEVPEDTMENTVPPTTHEGPEMGNTPNYGGGNNDDGGAMANNS
jgi:hypothetical protein